MKMKLSDIVLIVLAVAVIAMLGYNFMGRSGEGESTEVAEAEERSASPAVAERVLARTDEFSDDPEELVEQLRNAPQEKVKRYMKMILDTELPDDYEYPQFILDAGSGKESARLIGERYPEFYGLGGAALVEAARKHPVRYRELIMESKAYRVVYAHEVENK